MNQQVVKSYAARMAAERGVRRVSLYKAEEEMVRVIQDVARRLAPSFVFGYHTRQDIEQQGLLFALEAIDDRDKETGEPLYDAARPLANFIHIHIRNRLSNYKRDNYIRMEPPCSCCDPFSPPPAPCRKWQDWHDRNFTKQNLMRPLDVSSISDEGERGMALASEVEDEACGNELETLIDNNLPVDLRADYQRMRSQVMIPKARRQRVREAVATIARQAGYLPHPEEEHAV